MKLKRKVKELEMKIMELEQEKDGMALDLGYYKQLEGQFHNLQEHLVTVESEKYQMELQQRDSDDNINKTVVNNTKILINQLPQNSPFRQPFLFFLLQGLSCKEAIDLSMIIWKDC